MFGVRFGYPFGLTSLFDRYGGDFVPVNLRGSLVRFPAPGRVLVVCHRPPLRPVDRNIGAET